MYFIFYNANKTLLFSIYLIEDASTKTPFPNKIPPISTRNPNVIIFIYYCRKSSGYHLITFFNILTRLYKADRIL